MSAPFIIQVTAVIDKPVGWGYTVYSFYYCAKITIMSKLLLELEKRDITPYAMMQMLGENVRNDYTRWSRKFKGEQRISMEDIQKICQIATRQSGKKLEPRDLDYEVRWVMLK